MKRIVICCDGTWNTPDQMDGGVLAPTNVVRLYNCLNDVDDNKIYQHKYYHPGVGTDGAFLNKMIDGGIGGGLDRNIMSAYRELCDHYETGDEIYVFGFSRGAYTVRSLVGLISCCGLLNLTLSNKALTEAEAWKQIEQVYRCGYRKKTEDHADWKNLKWGFHDSPTGAKNIPIPIPIRFLGVWDTVGALGVPDDMAFSNLIDNFNDYAFHDTTLSVCVQTARHAVALDEMRATFQPSLWAVNPGNQDVKQVWFPGVHSDVGGGYRETGLSDGAFDWMIKEAGQCGLSFNIGMIGQIKPNHLDIIHDSCSSVFSVLATQPRSAPFLRSSSSNVPVSAQVSVSAQQRMQSPPIQQAPYRPIRTIPQGGSVILDIFASKPWNETGLWLNEGKPYTFAADGEWLDGSIPCGPAGAKNGSIHPGKAAHFFGSALGEAEDLFKRLTGNQAANFRFTKRHESVPWFCLMGAIANGGVDNQCQLQPHESFSIGKGVTHTPTKSGYFYAYANDSWGFYGNNKGRVRLTITQP